VYARRQEKKQSHDMPAAIELKRSNPEAEGISSTAVLEFIRALEQHVHPLSAVEGLQDMQAVLDKVWRILLPAMQPGALPVDPGGHEKLRQKISGLSLPLSSGQPLSPKMDQWSGKSYKLETNYLALESIAIEFSDRSNTLMVRDERGEHSFFCPILRFHYIDSELHVEIEPNVSWEPPRVTTIRGTVLN
jgi:hypothetical protein